MLHDGRRLWDILENDVGIGSDQCCQGQGPWGRDGALSCYSIHGGQDRGTLPRNGESEGLHLRPQLTVDQPVNACIHTTYLHAHPCTHTQTHRHTYVYTHICKCTYGDRHAHACSCRHAHTKTHIHARTHTYARIHTYTNLKLRD